MARLWTTDGWKSGELKQGKAKKKDQPWNFPLKSFDEGHGGWQSKVEAMLLSVKARWEEDWTFKLLADDNKHKTNWTMADQLIGFDGEDNFEEG